jgi:ectoine hydroxylase-related dioxygenase (phytanoyl-CoA dioxygenase family)
MSEDLLRQLERDGIALVPNLLTGEQLQSMRTAFLGRLSRMRWNDFDGFEKTEKLRHMVQDVLVIDQGFVDAALHPAVKSTLNAYLGDRYALVEAKGWKSLPTMKDFHGWHGDAWYDQRVIKEIPREVKLGIYLSDVETGAFQYVKGSHGKIHPRMFDPSEARPDQIVEMRGPAGTAFLFDTTGIHRAGIPILTPRLAVFLNFHDPSVPLQDEDVEYYRYHPLLLNAAFLREFSAEERRILGMGNKATYVPGFQRKPRYEWLQQTFRAAFEATLRADALRNRVAARMRRTFGRG